MEFGTLRWGAGILLFFASIFVYPLNPALTYGMVIAGLLTFVGSWVWRRVTTVCGYEQLGITCSYFSV